MGTANAALSLGLLDRRVDQSRPDFNKSDRFIKWLKRPYRDLACKAAAQAIEHRKAHQNLRADGTGPCQLPAGETAPCEGFAGPHIGERIAIALFAARQARHIVVGPRIAPKRPDPLPELAIDVARYVKPVVGLGAVLNAVFQPLPNTQRIVVAGQRPCKALGVAKGEIKADQEATACGAFGFDQVGQGLFGDLPIAQVKGRAVHALAGQAQPYGLGFRCGPAIIAAGPVDYGDRVEWDQSPTSDRMKSAMALVSSRSKTGRSSSSGVSLATARTVGSSGAISGLPVTLRCASTLGCVSRL